MNVDQGWVAAGSLTGCFLYNLHFAGDGIIHGESQTGGCGDTDDGVTQPQLF